MEKNSNENQMTMNRIIQEKFSAIQTNIQYMHRQDDVFRTVAITSSNKGEGKTFFSTNFAKTYANFKQKVLLIDVDFYSPSLTKQYRLKGRSGLSNVLTGRTELQDAVYPFSDDLDVLPVGAIPPNPLELLRVQGLSGLIEEAFALGYAYIIFDCPPINLFTDSRIVASSCDLGILVVNNNKTKEEELSLAKSLLDKSGVKAVGAVLNNVKYNKKKYDYYGY
ncbi:CpsD/CapB family tyrosine-protein kinase [Listeria fleischmannii]|uniref:non-specific protein-tyrosine kinase n=1 Tax=Listeria fleischmannii FSL S10-1203 TaxID=1265822 RepID=W7DEU2_9LIST|nr:CpsD/CapB family tyrosine-protein kinase [Listeria fleischmannii]EUJ47850.1 protein-tyrosine kinase [Listeria fleischmannii FSL S10-1203]